MTYTPGLTQLLQYLDPGSRPSGRVVFPPGLAEGGARRSAGELAHEWLERCARDEFDNDMSRILVEDNLAVFIVVRWDGNVIQYANLQAFWADTPLKKFVANGGGSPHRYLRLDYDLTALGPLLKEPHPHVHVEADGEPRFPVPTSAGDDVVGWFLDFVYRNYFYDDWIAWAEFEWEDWCNIVGRQSRWQVLASIFAQSKFAVLEQNVDLQRELLDLKACLLDKRRRLFPLRTLPSRLDLTSA